MSRLRTALGGLAAAAVLMQGLVIPAVAAPQPAPTSTAAPDAEFAQSIVRAGGGADSDADPVPPARRSMTATATATATTLTTITFSEFAVGTPITTQYASWGIVFGGDAPFITGDGANPTSPVLSGTPTFEGEIRGSFVTASGSPRTVDHLQLDVGYIDDPGSVEVTVFGIDGDELLTVAVDQLGIVRVVIDEPGSAAFVVRAVENETAGFAIDNVSFEGIGGGTIGYHRPVDETYGFAPHFGYASDPVNTATGNFIQSVTDLDIPAAPLLTWGRTYNSVDGAWGPFGSGWGVGPLAGLQFPGPGGGDIIVYGAGPAEVIYWEPSGRRWTFTPGDGTWVAPAGLRATLSEDGDGWMLSLPGGVERRFDLEGRPTSVRSGAETVEYTYDETGRPVTLVSSTGESLTLTYDEVHDWQLASVVASDGRLVRYGYDERGLLVTVTDPTGATTTYGYDDGYRLETIVDPEGRTIVRNTYDAAGRVDVQELGTGNTLRFLYDDATRTTTIVEGDGGTLVYVHDERGRPVRVEGPDGAVAERQWDEADTLVGGRQPGGAEFSQVVDAAGNVVESTFDGVTTRWTYDDRHRVLTETDVLGGTTTYTYVGDDRIPTTATDPLGGTTTYEITDGRVTAVTDADGYTTQLVLDARGLPVESVEPGGARTTIEYDAAGRVVSVTDALGGVTSTTYDEAGRVTSRTDATGATSRTTYSPSGQVLSTTDAAGAEQAWEYDDAGQITATTDAAGRRTTYEYDAQGDLVAIDGPTGRSVLAHDDYGRLVSSVDPRGTETTMTYDAEGRPVTSGAAGTSTALEYDERGNVLASTDVEGGVTRYEYDLLDRETAVTTPDGVTTTSEYDAAGRLVRTTTPSGTTVTEYTPAGRVLRTTGPDGGTTTFTYDAAGDQVTVTTPAGRVTTTTYDALHRPLAVTSPSGLTTRSEYDAVGRSVARIDAAGRVSRTTYSPRGEVLTLTAPDGGLRQFSYGADGTLRTATDANGGVTTYGYDGNGHITSVTDALGRITTYEVDALGRETAVVDPLGRRTEKAYDDRGNLVRITHPDDVVVERTWSPSDRLLSETASDGTSTTVTYDSLGRPATRTSASGTTSYAYTDGRLTEVTSPDGSTVGYGYDAAGRRTSVTYPDGGVVRYEYDADGLLTGVVDQTGAATTYRLDRDGRVVEAIMPEGVTRQYGYVAGELSAYTEVRPGRTSTTRLTRDEAGRVAQEVTDGVVRRYAYDAAGQLVRAAGVLGEPIRLGYDAVGNRTSITRGLITTRLTYDAADQLTRSATGPLAVTYGYDARGQLVTASGVGTRLSVAYDGLGRPTVTTAGVGSARVTYATSYGGEGLVDAVTRSTSRGSSTTRYRWSDDPVPQVLTQTGADSASFVYGHGRISAVADGASAVFSADVRGSALRTTATSPWVQALAYDVLGTPIGLPTLDLGFGYRGELGIGPFVHLRDRTLETATGRFTTRDRLDGIPGTVGSQNGYVYGFNDPVNQVDPLGQRAVSDAVFALAAFGGGQQACPDPSGYKRQRKCFQGVSLRTRGYLTLPNAIGRDYVRANQAWTTYWNTRRPERAAHTFTIRHLNWSRMTWVQKYLNGNLSVGDGMDWEVAPPNSSWRIDIVVDESEIFEVKRWDNGRRVAEVRNQLRGYGDSARALGVPLAASAELVGWADMFVVYSGLFDFSPDRVVVWGGDDPVGAVWFDTEDKVKRDVRVKANLKYNAEELGRQFGIPLPVPLPIPVPVPVP